MQCDYIQLNRTFHELSWNTDDNEEHISYRDLVLGEDSRLSWPTLLQEFRVILLSEAGTGKTEEIRHEAQSLRKKGEYAFFLRLEHVCTDFEDAFEVGTCTEFVEWQASAREGWIFLDSVDEARLKSPQDFELAIRKLGRRITDALQRTHIVITSRTPAWRPTTDLELCCRHLPYIPPSTFIVQDDEENLQDKKTESPQEISNKASPKIVAMDDLNYSQVEAYAAVRNVSDVNGFLEEVAKKDAWQLTTRPQDLEELVVFWKKYNSIGSSLELIQNSIERRLTERDQGRAEARPISSSRIREGARLIAAATTLTKGSTLRIPDGWNNAKGIPVSDILLNWNESEQAALLSRPIFDEAMYGTVRFHHRTLREFLTAEWLAQLLKKESSRRNIESLLFKKQYGLEVVIPTLRPVLPWLALLDSKILERLYTVAPEVLLEGGDPGQLPLNIRQAIFHKVCEQIATGVFKGGIPHYTSIQKFSSDDLTDDVKEELAKSGNDEHLNWFLLKMVWAGSMKEALQEAKRLALSPLTPQYTRSAAFDAVKAAGDTHDIDEIRTSFLNESCTLNRKWLADLIEGLKHSSEGISWLLDSVAKADECDRHNPSGLKAALIRFVQRTDLIFLPQIISTLNSFLNMPPVLEKRHCEVSQRFLWTLKAAAYGVIRLAETRNQAALEEASLAILCKLTAVQDYLDDFLEKLQEPKTRLKELIPLWPELNRACFWFNVDNANIHREVEGKGHIKSHWSLMYTSPFWKFSNDDFDYFLGQLAESTSLSKQFVALSLAFEFFTTSGRTADKLDKLKKVASINKELAIRLNHYLAPPKDTALKKEEAKRKRRDTERKRKQEKNRADWRDFLQKHVDTIWKSDLKLGQISNSLDHLYKIVATKDASRTKWSLGNWKCLIDEFGEEVALAYRDAMIQLWRGYTPRLLSEGASEDSVPYVIILGLSGLQLEANSDPKWMDELNESEAALACRYACFELNGFPDWLPSLCNKHPRAVCEVICKEIQHELATESPNSQRYHTLYRASVTEYVWYGLASYCYSVLEKGDPTSLLSLERLLTIIQGSAISDEALSKLVKNKTVSSLPPDSAERWLAVWAGVDPDTALQELENYIEAIPLLNDRTNFAMQFVVFLLSHRYSRAVKSRDAFRKPEYLKRLYLIMHKYIRAQEDIDRANQGIYTPTLRDDAQDARNHLSELLRNIPGKATYEALLEISDAHPSDDYKPWFRRMAKGRAEMDADITEWTPAQVLDFQNKLERTPTNHRDLAELVLFRFLDLKDDLENGDSSIAQTLLRVECETEMRTFIGRELREKAFGRYSIPQEEELADAKRPDLRFHGVGFDGPVPAELKLADKWSGPALFERLENQLCGDYLRDTRSTHGVFVLVNQGKDREQWVVESKRVGFDELIHALEGHWQRIAPKFPGVERVEVVGIDLTRRSKK